MTRNTQTETAQEEIAHPTGGTAVSTVERISEDEMAWHRRVVADVSVTRAKANVAEAVGASWFAHLAERYGLAPDDIVHPDGRIERVPAPAPTGIV